MYVHIKVFVQAQSGEENNWQAENKVPFRVLLRLEGIENFVYTCLKFFGPLDEGPSFTEFLSFFFFFFVLQDDTLLNIRIYTYIVKSILHIIRIFY